MPSKAVSSITKLAVLLIESLEARVRRLSCTAMSANTQTIHLTHTPESLHSPQDLVMRSPAPHSIEKEYQYRTKVGGKIDGTRPP